MSIRQAKDTVAEMTYGEGAVRVASRLFIRHHDDKNGYAVQSITGMVVSLGTLGANVMRGAPDNAEDEIWEAEIIIIPRRKYSGAGYHGVTVNEVLMRGCRPDAPYAPSNPLKLYWPHDEAVKQRLEEARPSTEDEDD